MINVKLSKRLKAIADLVDKDSKIIDVGCDHALLDIYLLKKNIIKKAIASDVNEGALNQAKRNIKLHNVKKISVRLSDGLDDLKKEDDIDTIVISGLGDKKIIDILNNDKDKLKDIKTIIIQSNTNPYNVRRYLSLNGYKIEDEKLILENNIIYTIIKFKKQFKKYSKKELFFGPILLKNKNDLFNKNIQNIIDKNNNILKMLPKRMFIKKIKIKYNNIKLKKEMKQ